MDKISVTEDSLREGLYILNCLDEDTLSATKACGEEIENNVSNIDANLRTEFLEFHAKIYAFYQDLRYLIQENNAAINERLQKIPEYEKNAYHPRHFG